MKQQFHAVCVARRTKQYHDKCHIDRSSRKFLFFVAGIGSSVKYITNYISNKIKQKIFQFESQTFNSAMTGAFFSNGISVGFPSFGGITFLSTTSSDYGLNIEIRNK